jgi:GcrA cell cycle regulator
MSWTEESDARLRTMREAGHSYTEIAAAFGLTKNQIVGRAHRLNLPVAYRRLANRPAPKPPAAPQAPRLAPARPILLRPAATSPAPSPHRACQFIEGEARGAATVFCDAPTLRGSSYCGAHHALCWHPRQVAA